MKKVFYLSTILFACCFSFPAKAQLKTVYDQLVYINKEWKNQVDIDPQLKQQPAQELSETQLIQQHLNETEKLLRSRKLVLNTIQQKNRLSNLDILHRYATAGIFPKNSNHTGRQPYFIDDNGTYCAAGYLMQQSGGDAIAKDIHRTQNFSYLKDIDHPLLMNWINTSGLTIDELALIQPGYPGDGPPSVIELHYNNTGTDVNEYIEIAKGAGLGFGTPISDVLFYDETNTVYKTLTLTQLSTFVYNSRTFYYYTFPAGENFADKGMVEVRFVNPSTHLPQTYSTISYSDVSVTAKNYSGTILGGPTTTKTFAVGESETTPTGYSLSYCGLYNSTNWNLSMMAATLGTLNVCVVMANELTDLSYTVNNKKVNLSWTTASTDQQDFIVERSIDGINFDAVGKLRSITGTSKYNFVDNSPNYINHYRIKQIDNNNHAVYSKLVYVKVSDASSLTILQNVITSSLRYQVSSPNASRVEVYDLMGKKVLSQPAKAGIATINTATWSSGKYIMRLYTLDGQWFTQQFIKQ